MTINATLIDNYFPFVNFKKYVKIIITNIYLN